MTDYAADSVDVQFFVWVTRRLGEIQFLFNVQRLLSDATYKHALLLSLADLAIERGDDHGVASPQHGGSRGEFVLLYWRQVLPWVRFRARRARVRRE